MTAANRHRVLGWIGLSEGGIVDDSRDPGGLTNRGITQATYTAWRKSQHQKVQSVKLITKAEADDILTARYLAPVGFDDLPSGLDYAMADYSTNSGAGRAVKELQAILGVQVDGNMGPITLQAVAARDTVQLIVALCEARLAFMKRIKHPKTGALLWPTFGKGWQARVMGKRAGVQADDIGVIDRAVILARGKTPDIPAPSVQAPGKAPEPAPEGKPTLPTAVGIGGAAAAGGSVLTALGTLHPIVQGIALVGVLLAAGALFYLWQRRGLRL